MRLIFFVLCLFTLGACSSGAMRASVKSQIDSEMDAAVATGASQEKVNEALLPPLPAAAPADRVSTEAKFDLSVNDTPAQQVFMAIVSGTRYSMLLHPDIDGNISLNLKDVTVFDALEAIREMYGYEYKIDGTRIYIQPLGLQTRIYQVNYLTGQREGKSSLRVSSGSVSDSPVSSTSNSGVATNSTNNRTSGLDSSKVSMSSNADFWDELDKSLTAIVGTEKGRSVVISPMSGVIVVRATADELKNVAAYLRASQISVERQVILEAKIVEVQLNETFQTGVNWAAMTTGPNSRIVGGMLGNGTTLANTGRLSNGIINASPGADLSLAAASVLPPAAAAGSLFGLAFQTSNFAALLNFLESQGDVHVLSSPRIATLNGQKAVLKVGTDEFFVTNVTNTTTTGTATTSTPSVTLQPFFSGIALDVTPRIDQNGEIILHVHPSVSLVSTVNKTVDVGGVGGTLNLPLASSSVSETDSIVRARDGQIVAIGGLMRQATFDNQSGLPGMPKAVFGQTNKTTQKRELVILLKPTIVSSENDWADDVARSRDRIKAMTR
ncbi:MAG: general secretion pathway protein GspD [Gallionella sp.]|nr:general secretion pathway protein GspD [Gallionella sp.]PIY05467.1 MAG: general secretion pathway protein GspD [Gallionellaceae bacterium CG_4_10_14_3_um_filter_60_1069]PJC04944.1 MAG: general secretion pathway protein GspD [Gallionellaceae bacterium CG_4_9_14_0_8_um_filter_60_335]